MYLTIASGIRLLLNVTKNLQIIITQYTRYSTSNTVSKYTETKSIIPHSGNNYNRIGINFGMRKCGPPLQPSPEWLG